jgi:hypothetical protein
VEQFWRDNRLNMIHEGTHGIQALDLLGRKVVMQQGAGLQAAGHAHQRHHRARPPGRLAAARYFFHYELPKIGAWLKVVESRDLTCADCPEEAF